MQPDNKYSFLPTNWSNKSNNQVAIFNESYCKKVLSHCDRYLNSYIKYLVPPQESCCEHLKRILLQCNESQQPTDTNLRLIDEPDVVFLDDPEHPPTFPVAKPSTPKVCRFVEVPQVVPIHETTLFLEEPTEAVLKVKPFRAFVASEDVTDAIRLPSPSKSKVAFIPNQFQVLTIPDTKTPEDIFTPPICRPKYTTQVSTISQKSNTVNLYSCWPPPVGITVICVLEVILFAVNEQKPIVERYSYGNIADTLMYDPTRRKEVWRYMTYLFVHIGYQHLLFNLGVQIFLGVILEMVHDRWRVLSIYSAGVLAGSLGTSVMSPRVKLAGASGGVYSLITAHIVTVILKWKHMQYPATQFLAFLIVIVTDMGTGIYSYSQNKVEDIGYTAHACGALAGFLVGFPILRKLSKTKQVRWFQFIGLVIYFALILFAAIWNVVASDLFPKQAV